MSEPTGPGMGRPSGPGFAGPPGTGGQPPDPPGLRPTGAPTADGRRRPAGPAQGVGRAPRPSRLPTLLTVLSIAVVAVIVAVASVVAAREDVRRATPPPVSVGPADPSPGATDQIEFATSTGNGVLEIVDHGWDSDGTDTEAPGSLLTLAVEIRCTSGVLRYGPDSFQAFDRSGDLFEPEVLAESPTALELGILSAGQRVRGTVAFDIPRGGVTLLMSDDGSRTITALKVPD